MAKINLFEKTERAEFNLVQAQNARKTYNDLIVANSCFYECLIVEAIADLVTTIEGRKFISTDAILFYMEPIKNGRKGKIIIDEGIYSYYHYSDLSTYKPTTETLIQNGFIIYVDTHFGFEKIPVFNILRGHIKFNDTDIKINFDIFGYVKDFFKTLVQYCYEKGIKEPNKENINECMRLFLRKYKKEHSIKNPIFTLTNERKGE